ncbi:MAG TPA: alpha/beta fold hydrolase [Holophagaceae bacterium]|nr:alpha/beta fold hydrolase [Holophagaceae bacterium]
MTLAKDGMQVVRHAYGPAPAQVGDLYLPGVSHPAIICLLHGGFWRAPYGPDQMAEVAQDLAGRGFAVWNLGYRRVGEEGGGWPGTLQDVAAGIDHLARIATEGVDLDLDRVTVVGHSAGGHLALWSAARDRAALAGAQPARVRVAAAVGLAPVADLRRAHALGLGNGAVEALLGGTPEQVPDRFRSASPRELLPLGVPQLILHGAEDAAVPLQLARAYAEAAEAAGDPVTFVALPGMGHMEFLDPASAAHAALCGWLLKDQKT